MKKLIRGILDFRDTRADSYRDLFAQLALGQKPDSLFFSCSDSRVAVNVFASTDPGDLFVVRNVGNLIPSASQTGHSVADESEAAAIEFALGNLNVKNIIVCGHSECGAMQALVSGRQNLSSTNLRSWLRHGENAIKKIGTFRPDLAAHNELSQLNVIQQIENLKTYPIVQARMQNGELALHGLWFDIRKVDVYGLNPDTGHFEILDRKLGEKFLARVKGN